MKGNTVLSRGYCHLRTSVKSMLSIFSSEHVKPHVISLRSVYSSDSMISMLAVESHIGMPIDGHIETLIDHLVEMKRNIELQQYIQSKNERYGHNQVAPFLPSAKSKNPSKRKTPR